jgi:pilus assembly protein FimV
MLESRGINDLYRMQRTILSIALGLIFNISAAPALALNLGKGTLGSTLGQPLNFSVTVNSEPEEGITPECVNAEVFSGDNKLAAGAVRISSDGAAGATQFTVRVSTNVVIDEPVVTVAVALGCPAKVTRRFILFVDPPLVTSNAEVAADQGFRPIPTERSADLPKPASSSTARPFRNSGRGAPASGRAAASPDAETVVRPQRRNIAAVPVPEGSAAPKAAIQRPPALAKAPTPAAAAPRLKLDSAPRVVTAPAPSASAAALLADALASKAAAEAASAAAASASAVNGALQEAELRAARRVAALEESLLKLKAEAQASRKSIETLQATVRQADAGRTPPALVWALAGLSAALAAAVAALLWLQARRRRNPSWWTGGSAEPHPSVSGQSVSPETRSSRAMADGAEPGFGSSPFSASQRDSFTVASGPAPLASASPSAIQSARGLANGTTAATSSVTATAVSSLGAGFGAPAATAARGKSQEDFSAVGSPRELSVEELIDLEQQADFFVVLGQDEAAIDLLMTHVRSTGGLSPMPYMKLLEIYRRLGNHEAYERIRDRFNQRFNGEVPAAEADPEEGRSITDYPDTLGELIAVWPTPFKAVDTLGRWLARSDSDAPGGSLAFDLPAYSELLFLHSLARDLSAREPRSGGIDVLLPLAVEQASPISSLQATLPSDVPSLMTDSGYELDLDLSLPMPLPAANSKQTDYDNAGPKSDFMSLNIDSRFQS